jgi:hypothetical protein
MNKKLKLFLAGMFGVALTFGILVISCDNGTTDGESGNTDPKTITITDLGEQTGKAKIQLGHATNGQVDAEGTGTISGGSVTISLKVSVEEGEPSDAWTGTGPYYLMLYSGGSFIYTNGDSDADKAVKITISEANTTVSFTKFAKDE